MTDELDLVTRLKIRASIRRNIQTRKSVQEGKPDRISDLLEEAAKEIETLRLMVKRRTTFEKIYDYLFKNNH
jgi:hypothetical protein